MRRFNNRGFTIIELLISMVIFSLVLLIITGAIVQFSKIYYNGTIKSRTQEVARTIAEDMARSAQFSSASVDQEPGRCYKFGSQKYVYKEKELKIASNNIFQAGSGIECGGDPTNPIELMGENMQLLDVDVSEPTTDMVKILVIVGYGSEINYSDNTCPTISLGGQFCAVSKIETVVSKRK